METPFIMEKSTFYGSSGANFPNQCQKDGHEIQVWPLRLLHVTSNKFRSVMDTGPKPVHQHLPWNLTAGASWMRGLGCFAPGTAGRVLQGLPHYHSPLSLGTPYSHLPWRAVPTFHPSHLPLAMFEGSGLTVNPAVDWKGASGPHTAGVSQEWMSENQRECNSGKAHPVSTPIPVESQLWFPQNKASWVNKHSFLVCLVWVFTYSFTSNEVLSCWLPS